MKLNKTIFLILLFLINFNLIYSFNLKKEIKISNDKINLPTYNPWIFQDRLNLYSILINSTNIPVFGVDNSNNCLHGLQLQFEWQNRSGRLEINQGHVNTKSWWGDMNYYLSIIPYLSAMKMGIVPIVEIVSINDQRFCSTYEDCDQEVLSNWDNFFQQIINIRNNGSEGDDQQLLKFMWTAHIGSIDKATKLFTDSLLLLPKNELRFGNGWAHFVDVIATVNFNTNYSTVYHLGQQLPPIMLNGNDTHPSSIESFTKEQRNVVLTMYEINDLSSNNLVWNSFMYLLKKMTKNEICRNLINNEINLFLNSPVPTIIEILFDILTNNC
ncbi:hypothetical protein ACTFIY_002616 [Dictyostelium cf. discoideum]